MKRSFLASFALFALATLTAAAAEFTTLDLAPLKRAGAFGDAGWKDGFGKKTEVLGVPFRIMAPEGTADAPFSLDLTTARAVNYTDAYVLFAVDEANDVALPFVTVRFTAGGKTGEVTLDLRGGEGAAREVGRILRGPSGTLHYPVMFARIPLHPVPVAAAENGGERKLEFLPAEGEKCRFSFAAVTLRSAPPLKPIDTGFTLSFKADLDGAKDGELLYEAEGALQVRVRDAVKSPAPGDYDEINGNYYNFRMPDGSCPVLEAYLPGATGRLGVPLAALKNPRGVHAVRVVFNGIYYVLDVDERRDEDFPIAPLRWPVGDRGGAKSPRVKDLAFDFSAVKGPVARPAPLESGFHSMYWNPSDHNRWLGDIVTTTWDGRLHVFYLADRRHHNSAGGRGGHYFEHIVTDDLVSWTELPTAVPRTRHWEHIGTGTPFRMGEKYCIAYGLHSLRHGTMEELKAQGVPIGGTYAVGDDGIHFTKTDRMITEDQNPSVYNRPDGTYGMGRVCTLEQAPAVEGPWTCVVTNAPVHGDCPCPFEWNGWHYIIQGFCTMARSKTGENGTWTDEVLDGYDVYEGLSVPMVAPWKGNRRILIGWINHVYGWGGWLCCRELVQYPDGHLGTKWVKEMPMPVEPVTMGVKPGETVRVDFEPQDGRGRAFAFLLDSAAGKARFALRNADGSCDDIPTLKDLAVKAAPKWGCRRICAGRKYRPDDGNDFAIGNIRGLDRPFEVKLVNYFDRKSGCTLVDVEIAGQRTMVTRRLGRFATSCK